MTEPLAADRYADIRAELVRPAPNYFPRAEVAALLAEVERLRAENAGLDDLRLRAIDKGDKDRAERDELRARVDEVERAYTIDTADLKRQVAKADRALGEVIDGRDAAQDMADKLAYAVAPIEVIGEHSSGNCPWENALELITPAAEVARLRARVAELEAAAAPKLCICGHSNLVHTVPEPHSCFAVGQTCACPAYRQLPPAEAEAQLRKNIQASEARAAEQAAAIIAAGPLCTCRAFPAAHRLDLHDEHGQVVDIDQVPSEGWDKLLHAKCTRCGWISDQSWFAGSFTEPMAQNVIAVHRDRWTGRCV